MPDTPPRLLSRRFLPYFLTQALGAFNDNAFRFSVMFLLTYRLGEDAPVNVDVLMNLAAGLFILPFLLFSPVAGHWTDRVDQARLARLLKWTELGLMTLAGVAFWLQNTVFLLTLVFLMGVQSAWFGPLKYAIVPRHLPTDHLMRANGWVTASTFAAILGGTLTGGLLTAAGEAATLWASAMVIGVALAGVLASRFIPPAPPLETDSEHVGPVRGWLVNWALLRRQRPRLRQNMWLISWFWFVGTGYLTQFPRFSREWLGLDAGGATGLLALFAMSIGVGGLAVGYLSFGRSRPWLAPLATLGVAAAALDWYLTSITGDGTPDRLRIAFDVAATGIAAGVLVVPLYSYLQTRSDPTQRARIIALLNVQNALAMVASSLLGMLLFGWAGIELPTFFLLFGGSGALVSLWLWWRWRGLSPAPEEG
ncbi:MAG: MFS transporter [Pseudomonadota bacterium]